MYVKLKDDKKPKFFYLLDPHGQIDYKEKYVFDDHEKKEVSKNVGERLVAIYPNHIEEVTSKGVQTTTEPKINRKQKRDIANDLLS